MARVITREEFDRVYDAIWSEIRYVNSLPRRTDEEAKDVPGFLNLLSILIDRGGDAWYDNAGNVDSLPWLRKIAATAVRAMIYCGAADGSPSRSAEPCEGCDGTGVRPDTNNGRWITPPDGFQVVERCDACARFANDMEAAATWGTHAHWQAGDDGEVQAIAMPKEGDDAANVAAST